jgi:ribosome biogenesis SPOUT family RNA methylase Rps3
MNSFKQAVIIEQKNDKIEELIEGYKEILRQLNHNFKVAQTEPEKKAYYTARDIVEETMIEITGINVTDI